MEQARDGFVAVGCTHEDGGGLCPRHGQFDGKECPGCREAKSQQDANILIDESE